MSLNFAPVPIEYFGIWEEDTGSHRAPLKLQFSAFFRAIEFKICTCILLFILFFERELFIGLPLATMECTRVCAVWRKYGRESNFELIALNRIRRICD